jgi:hypothetical protein
LNFFFRHSFGVFEMVQLPPTPGSDAVKALFLALDAAATSLEESARVNFDQISGNNEQAAALNAQSDELTTVANSALEVANGIRGLLPPAVPPTPAPEPSAQAGRWPVSHVAAPQVAIAGRPFANVFANLIKTLEALTARLIELSKVSQ